MPAVIVGRSAEQYKDQMTGAQRSYLHTLAQEAKREVPEDLTKAQASEMIDELQSSTGRG